MNVQFSCTGNFLPLNHLIQTAVSLLGEVLPLPQSDFLHDIGLFVSLQLLRWPLTYQQSQPVIVYSPAQSFFV